MADRKTYLENVPVENFYEIIPRRKKVIEAASAELPRYEYTANTLDKLFHPAVQHVVVSDIKEMKDAKLYTLVPDKAAGTERLAPFRAGQYISVTLKIGKSLITRPYSLCSAPSGAAGSYQIVVKTMKDGFASEYINKEWKKGTKADISGPCGFFYYERLRDSKNIVGLAGGSGIAPFRALAKAIADGTEDCSLTLLFGSRTEADILFKDEFDEIAAKCDKFRIVHVLSDEQKEGYENGFITADLIKKYAPEDGDYSLFVCGSQGMYDFVEGEAEKLGLKRRRVRMDAYGEYKLTDRDEAVKDTKDKTFTVTVTLNDGVEHKIQAKGSESLLTAFERAGLKAPSRCRSGECGWCRSRLVSGTVYMPEKVERRREYDKIAGYIHPCCAFPTSDCVIYVNYEAPEKKRTVKDMAKKNRTMGIVMSILISAAMGALASFLVLKTNPQAAAATPPKMMYISNIALSVLLGLIVALVLPLGKLGRKLADKHNAKPSTFKFTLLNAIPLSIGNTLIISLILSFFGVFMGRRGAPAEALANMPPLPVMWLGSWLKLLLPTLIASYVISVLISPTVSDMIGLTSAGAEVGKASAKDVSIEAKRKEAEKKAAKEAEAAAKDKK